jgi:hypothetical protein
MTKDELKKWCRANWDTIDENRRQLCIIHLRSKIPASVIANWKRDGYDQGRFHFPFGGGMAVRNMLRDIILDKELPPVKQLDGSTARNWDDFYTGALDQLLGES